MEGIKMCSVKDLKDLSITLNLVDENLLALQLDGFLDLYNSDLFEQYIDSVLNDWDVNIALDCKGLKHVNSTGFLVLVKVQNKLKEKGKNLYLVDMPEKILEKLEIVGISRFFHHAKNVIDVMNDLSSQK